MTCRSLPSASVNGCRPSRLSLSTTPDESGCAHRRDEQLIAGKIGGQVLSADAGAAATFHDRAQAIAKFATIEGGELGRCQIETLGELKTVGLLVLQEEEAGSGIDHGNCQLEELANNVVSLE